MGEKIVEVRGEKRLIIEKDDGNGGIIRCNEQGTRVNDKGQPLVVDFSRTKAGSVEVVEEAIRKHGGNISRIAKSFGVDRHTIMTWCKSSDILKEALNDSREILLDKAEQTMNDLLDAEDSLIRFKTSQFILATAGRKRGYGRDEIQEEKKITDDEKKKLEKRDSIKNLLDEYFSDMKSAESVPEKAKEEVDEEDNNKGEI